MHQPRIPVSDLLRSFWRTLLPDVRRWHRSSSGPMYAPVEKINTIEWFPTNEKAKCYNTRFLFYKKGFLAQYWNFLNFFMISVPKLS